MVKRGGTPVRPCVRIGRTGLIWRSKAVFVRRATVTTCAKE